MIDVSLHQSNTEAQRQALGQARMWRNLALQCRALADQHMAADAEAIASAYERRAEKLKPLPGHGERAP